MTFANPVPGNGGSPIISYELQIDDGKFGSFTSIVGYDSNSLLTVYTLKTGIVKGTTYRMRYRAKNLIGWGPFSQDAVILAANTPSIPPRPTFNSFVAPNQLILNIFPVTDAGGDAILYYEIWRNQGIEGTPFSLVGAILSRDSMTFSDYSPPALGTTGLAYEVRANNTIGYS